MCICISVYIPDFTRTMVARGGKKKESVFRVRHLYDRYFILHVYIIWTHKPIMGVILTEKVSWLGTHKPSF